MRIYIVLAFFCYLALALAEHKDCKTQSDCGEDECCLNNLFFKRPHCYPRYGAGKRCITLSRYDEDKDQFLVSCPCVKGHECKGEEVEEDGYTIVKNPKCV
ncbi:toxin CSTX-20 [Parasteatoda tepidariorum]|uniref:toxin CSTX-20 n=1 Tax=Parasteatoda tepidariorum TaxID=114398 RepID=UPI001C724452|nr:toxin CSTX-20 [Parasteatoda tepidariorum]